MNIDFFGYFSAPALYIMLGLCGISLLSIILAIVAICKLAGMKKKYKKFMEGSEGESIEALIKQNLDDYNELRKIADNNSESIKDIYDKMQHTFQKIGLIKYDAFHEMGGKLSFSLCMLDKLNNGYLVNVMHSNTGCFAYAKEIIDGKSFTELGDEEQKALEQAIAGSYGDVDLSSEINEMLN